MTESFGKSIKFSESFGESGKAAAHISVCGLHTGALAKSGESLTKQQATGECMEGLWAYTENLQKFWQVLLTF